MYRRILPLLIFGSFMVTFADSEVQTDWSGGPGVLGPVIELSDQFYHDTGVEWGCIPGDIVLHKLMYTVDEEFSGASSVYSEDINGDGDMDVVCAAFKDDEIIWWENLDGLGTSWTEHTVDGDFDGALSVYSEDINGDGDMDILGAARFAYDITWWENLDGIGTSWSEHTVDDDFENACSVYSDDIDSDGDMDILGAANYANDITWWENSNGLGTSWIEHTVDGNFGSAWCVYSEDINGDGDIDILGAAWGDDDITWWENLDGLGTSWAEHNIESNFNSAMSVYSQDIDGDGDMDVLGAAWLDDDITWWENLNGLGTSWTEHTIDGDFDGACSVFSEDIDGDGDMDVLGVATEDDDITWWENLNGLGTSWTEHTVDGNFDGASSVYSEDINGDGDMDILGAAYDDDDITWWDINNYSACGELVSSILNLGNDPDWGAIDWNASTPSGTSVSFLVRASDDYGNMGIWSDTLTAPCSLDGILNDYDSYFQYTVILETESPETTTPSLYDVTISWDPLGIEESAEPIPSGTEMFPFSPNPASSPAVRFGLPEPASVDISIFDLSGRLVSEIHEDEYSSGFHNVLIGDLSTGIYFCRMISGSFSATECFVVIE